MKLTKLEADRVHNYARQRLGYRPRPCAKNTYEYFRIEDQYGRVAIFYHNKQGFVITGTPLAEEIAMDYRKDQEEKGNAQNTAD